jgi:hypothetical protein
MKRVRGVVVCVHPLCSILPLALSLSLSSASHHTGDWTLCGWSWLPRVVVIRALPESTTVADLIAAFEAAGLTISMHAHGKLEAHIVQREVLDPGVDAKDSGDDDNVEGDDDRPTGKSPKQYAPVVLTDANGNRSVTGLVQLGSVLDQHRATDMVLTINGVDVQPMVVSDEPVANTREEIDDAMALATSMDRAQGNYLYLSCIVVPRPGCVERETCGICTTGRWMQTLDVQSLHAWELALCTLFGGQIINRQSDADSRYLRLAEVMVLWQLKRRPGGRLDSVQRMQAFIAHCASFGMFVSAQLTVAEFDMFVSTPVELRRPRGVSAARKLGLDPAAPFDERFESIEYYVGLRLEFMVGWAPVMGGISRAFGSDAYHAFRNWCNASPANMHRTIRLGSHYVTYGLLVACYDQLRNSGLTVRDVSPRNKTSQVSAVNKIARPVRDWIRGQTDGLGTAIWLDVMAWFWKAMNDERISPLHRMSLMFRVNLFLVGCTNQLYRALTLAVANMFHMAVYHKLWARNEPMAAWLCNGHWIEKRFGTYRCFNISSVLTSSPATGHG